MHHTLKISSLLTLSLSTSAVFAADITALEQAARSEGKLYSVGMPDSWANWQETWQELSKLYGLKHQDTDMSSAQEIAKFAAEKDHATADIGDVGAAFGPIALRQGVTQAYKPTTWEQIPDWAKDPDGHWMLGYTGTIAFIVNNELIHKAPTSWQDLLDGDYQVTVGDVGVAAQANSAVLAAAFALGGDESNIKPALNLFADLAKQGRLSPVDPNIANLEKGEVEMAILWDFNALNYRDQIDPKRFSVVIPSDGSLISGYTTIINLARGYARPIRSQVTLPEEVKAKLLPDDMYTVARPITDHEAWEKSTRTLSRLWQSAVLIHQQR